MALNTQMKTQADNSLKRNLVYQLLYEILILIIPLILSPYLTRVLGAEALGTYTYYYVIANYFVLFSLLGLKNHGKRTIASSRDHADELHLEFSNLITLHVIISVVCCLGYVGYIFILAEQRFLAGVMGLQVLSGLFDISWFYFGLEKFKLTVLRSAIIKILTVAAIFIFVHQVEDLWIYCLIMSVGMLLGQLVLWMPLRKYIRWVRPKKQRMLGHLKPMILLFIPGIAVSLYKLMDKLMLGNMYDHEQLGLYDNAEKIVNLPLTVITAFGAVMIPRISNLVARKAYQQTEHYARLSFYYVMWLAYAFAFGLAGIGEVFAPVFWGEAFRSADRLMMGLSVTLPFLAFANIIRTQFLIPCHRDKAFLGSVVAGAVVNIGLNLLLIPAHGAWGAVIATIAAEVTVCFVQCFCVRKTIPIGTYFRESLFFVPLAVLMFIIVYAIGMRMGESVGTLLVQIASGALFYVTVSCVYFYCRKDKMFMKLLAQWKRLRGCSGGQGS